MTDSRRIAGLLGPALIAVSISEAMNPTIWTSIIAPVVYLSGALWFVAGLSIVRVHNCWKHSWPVLITLVGWFLILGGLIRMIAPGIAQQQVQDTTAVVAGQMVLLAIGIVLTFKAYGSVLRSRATDSKQNGE
jgi:predicted phage tail protein